MAKKERKFLGEPYSPLHFLGALGAGGLAITFFMYLMWMTLHAGSPIPTFATLAAQWEGASLGLQVLTAIGVIGIAVFSVLHVSLLAWNWQEYRAWQKTKAYTALREGNAESQLMALPLTLAMTVNLSFIVGAVFVPNLWDMREALFPLALVGFGAVGVWAIKIYLDFFSRILTQGGYDCAKSNSLGQMISVFAFAMVGVGFSATAAMSHVPATATTGFAGAVFFTAAAALLGVITLILGFRSMMENKAAVETTPTLWIVIPILTVAGIAIYRLKMALVHNYGGAPDPAGMFAFLLTILAVQLFFGLLGWAVMRRAGYYKEWIAGDKFSAGSYALICPGVALFVFANFVINAGFVKVGLVVPGGCGYVALYLPFIAVQIATILLFARLLRKARLIR